MELFLIIFFTALVFFVLGGLAMYYMLSILAKRQMRQAMSMMGGDPMEAINQMFTALTTGKTDASKE